MRTQDNRAALGLDLLLDPNRSQAAIGGIESRETSAPQRYYYYYSSYSYYYYYHVCVLLIFAGIT